MKEYKFRAWGKWKNSDKKRMLYADDETTFYDSEGAFPDEIIKITTKHYGWIWMQYTGLKDKNGKKIFERDILKTIADDSSLLNYKEEKNIEVIYKKRYFHAFNIFEKSEVIGNTLENPELLST